MTFSSTISPRVVRSLSEPFQNVSREVDELLGRVLNREGGSFLGGYPVDVVEDADKLTVLVDLPGFAKEHVDVTLDNNLLTISAERLPAPEPENSTREFLLRERKYGKFTRSFTLPNTVDETTVAAKLEHGVLHVTLDKRQEAKPRKITVG
jgi:HSP20 family protein